MNTPDTEDTSNTRKVHVNTLPVNTPDTEWREELEGRLFAYLGAMNMLGVMEGKTTDGTIVQRDKAVDDILQIVQSLLTSRDTYWKERVRKEVEGMDIVSTSYECGVGYRQAKHDILQALDNLK